MRLPPRSLSLVALTLLALAARGDPPAEPGRPAPLDSYGDPLPQGAFLRLGTARWRHGGHVNALLFSRDGKTLFSAGGDRTVRAWDAATGEQRARIPAMCWVNALALSRDGKTLAWGGDTQAVYLTEPATGRAPRRLTGHEHIITSLAFSPDGKTLASAADDRTVRFWDVATGRQRRLLQGHPKGVGGVAFSPDGRLLASAGGDGRVRLWDPAAGREIRRLEAHRGSAACVAFSPDGKALVSGGSDRTIRLWDPATGREVRRFEGQGEPVRCLAFSADGRLLVSGGGEEPLRGRGSTVCVWDVAAGKLLRRLEGHSGHVGAVAVSPDGRLVAAGGQDHTVLRWDLATGRLLDPRGHGGSVDALAFSPDGKTLAAAGWTSVIRLWDLGSGEEARRLPGHRGRFQNTVGSLAFSADGSRLASAGDDGLVRLWDPATGREVRRLAAPRDVLACATLSPDGRTLAAGYYNEGAVRLWDPATGRELRRLALGPAAKADFLGFLGDGRTLLVGGSGDRAFVLRWWDAAAGHELRRQGERPAHAAALSADGRVLAVAWADGIRLAESATGRPLAQVAGPAEQGLCLALSPDGRLLAGGDGEGRVRLWEVLTGREVRRWAGHQGAVTALAFAPDGRALASGGDDTNVLLWDVTGRREGRALRPAALARPEALWADLAKADAASAHAAVWALVAAPGRAVPFLGERLGALHADAVRTDRLIAELGDARFAVRDRATRELARLGPAAVPPLERALARGPAPEVRRRLEELLRRVPRQARPGERWRASRAVWVLEQIGTPTARRVLETAAGGPADDFLAREARLALARLAGRRPNCVFRERRGRT